MTTGADSIPHTELISSAQQTLTTSTAIQQCPHFSVEEAPPHTVTSTSASAVINTSASSTTTCGADMAPIEILEARAVHGTVATENSCTIHYWLYGNGPKHIIFLEGLDCPHYGWEEGIIYFSNLRDLENADMFTVLGMDNRGVGKSTSTPRPYTTALMARDCVAVLTAVGWWTPSPPSNKINLVGFSLGGMIAQELFSVNPDKFETLSLISTSPGGPHVWSALPSASGVYNMFIMTIASDPESKRKHLISIMFSDDFVEKNKAFVWKKVTKREQLCGESNPVGFKGQVDAVMSHNSLDSLVNAVRSAPSVRVLVLCGTGDVVINPKNSKKMAAAIGAERCKYVVVPGAGHHIKDECSDTVNTEIRKLILGV
ncbi:alpha beta-hydrolase [Pelomyxa schiedti]|nr:alpha beta-hydrolase [Pelomyxa schiedti]